MLDIHWIRTHPGELTKAHVARGLQDDDTPTPPDDDLILITPAQLTALRAAHVTPVQVLVGADVIELPAALAADLRRKWGELNEGFPEWYPTLAHFVIEALKDKVYGPVYAAKHFPERS